MARTGLKQVQFAVTNDELKVLKHKAVDEESNLIEICRTALGFPAQVPADDEGDSAG